jgi:hypothetical protein
MCGVVPTREQAVEIARRVTFNKKFYVTIICAPLSRGCRNYGVFGFKLHKKHAL